MRIAIRNLNEIRSSLKRKSKAIKQAGVKTTLDGARLISNKAKELAPKKTGALINGILIRKTKQGHSVLSTVPGTFPYNKWVNESPGFETVLLPTMRIMGRWPTRSQRNSLGIEKPWFYRDTNHTGTPGFFDIAIQQTRQEIPKKLRDNIRTAIK